MPTEISVVTAAHHQPNSAHDADLSGHLGGGVLRSEEHTSEIQSQSNLVCRLLLETKNKRIPTSSSPGEEPELQARALATKASIALGSSASGTSSSLGPHLIRRRHATRMHLLCSTA